MLITKVERKYSKSINTKNYGLPESWIKVEASYEAQVESTDDAIRCSELLYDAAKNDVVSCVNDLITRIRGNAPAPAISTTPASTPVTPAPVATPVAAPAVPYNENPTTGEVNITATPAEIFPSNDNDTATPTPASVPPVYAAGVPANPSYAPRPL